MFGAQSLIPLAIFHLDFQKLSPPTVSPFGVRSDLLLSSIPLPPSAICHSGVFAAKHLFWKDFKAHIVSP